MGEMTVMTSQSDTDLHSLFSKALPNLAEVSRRPIKERTWIWDQIIPEGKAVSLGGPPGAGKSLLAQTICMAASRGMELFGFPTLARPTLYLTCEDDIDKLHRRAVAIARNLGKPTSDFTDAYAVSLEGITNTSLCLKDGATTKFYKLLEETISNYEIGLVVLDVVSDYWDGNEIIRQEVNHFVKGVIGSLACRQQVAIMLLYHPSVQGKISGDGQSGSTAWEGSVRSRLYLNEDKNGVRELSVKKSNYSERRSINLTWSEGAFGLTDDRFFDPALKDGGRQELGRHASNILAMLKESGGEASYSEISKRFGAKPTSDGVKALINRGLAKRDNGLVYLND